MPRPQTKAIDTYALKRAASVNAAVTMALAICHYLTRTQFHGFAVVAFPIVGIALLISLVAAPIIFAFLYGRQDGYSIPRTTTWGWATSLLTAIGVWTTYGIFIISAA